MSNFTLSLLLPILPLALCSFLYVQAGVEINEIQVNPEASTATNNDSLPNQLTLSKRLESAKTVSFFVHTNKM